jgi:hypothetical protein
VITEVVVFESPDLNLLYFCLWVWMRSDVYKREVDIGDELLANILDAAARKKKKKMPSSTQPNNTPSSHAFSKVD